MELFLDLVLLQLHLDFFHFSLLTRKPFFDLFCMSISGFEQFFGLLVGNIGKLVGSLLLKDQSFNSVFQGFHLSCSVLLDKFGLNHIDSVFNCFSTTSRRYNALGSHRVAHIYVFRINYSI